MQKLLLSFFLLTTIATRAQKVLIGRIHDQQNEEQVPFASVRFKGSGIGQTADSAGGFAFHFEQWTPDTLEVTSVGYRDLDIPILPLQIHGDTLNLTVHLIPGKFTAEVVVRKKINRGLIMWRRIVRRKPFNDRYRFSNFSYELYNKLELDLKNLNYEKLSQARLMRPFSFIFKNIDTFEGVTYLPAYLTEAISNYYYQKGPLRRREVFKGVKTIGVDNPSLSRLLGGMDQNIDIYDNFIPVFDKQFVSPISDNGDNYYNYKVADTQYVAGRRLIHFLFTPKRKGENTFEGDCWVNDTTMAIQKMNLRLGKEANINYVDRLSLIQEYQLINDSTWFLAKDKFVVDVSPLGRSTVSFIGRKTTTYRNVVVNDPSVANELAKNTKIEETVLPDAASNRTDSFWTSSRHEQLSHTEQGIYNMVDTLVNMPAFKRYTRTINFLGTGYLPVGNYLIGPWQNWIYSNLVEGLRLRFDLGTNSGFSKKVIFHGYAAYGFSDHKWKGEADAFYLFSHDPRMYLYGSFVNDFDYGQNYFDEISSDNIFALAIRKAGVPIKYMKLREERLDWFKEWKSGFSILLSNQRKEYNPIRNLPTVDNFQTKVGDPLNSYEVSVRFRFAYLEKFLENSFYRTSLGSPYPIVEFNYSKGIPGILHSSYDYHKLSASISNYRNIPPYGSIYFNVFAGRTFGTLPYMFLDVAPGNELHYYNRYAFDMMNKFEFIHDRYVGVNVEHNFGNGLFRFIPLTRKLKFRQFWTAKALWGSLSEQNRALNAVNGFTFDALNGRTYLELGTGVDNILKVLRFDFVWRPLPASHSYVNSSRFGIFGSFRFAF